MAGSPLSPDERVERARMGAHTLHAQGKTNTAVARAALDRKFLDEVDPDRELPEAERMKRAEHAKKAHFARLAYESAKARNRKKGRA